MNRESSGIADRFALNPRHRFRLSHFALFASGGLLLVFGLFIRLYTLCKTPLIADEIIALHFTKFSFGGIIVQLLHYETHPPIFYFLLKIWKTLVGYHPNFPYRNLMWVRLWGLGCFLLTFPALYFFLKREQIRNLDTALFLALFATHPLFVATTTELRPYGLLILWCVLALDATARAIEAGTQRSLALWVLWSTLAFNTHYYAVFFIASQMAGLIQAWKEKKRPGRVLLSYFVIFGASCLPAVALLFNKAKLNHLHPLTYAHLFTYQEFLSSIESAFLPQLTDLTSKFFHDWLLALFALCLILAWIEGKRKSKPFRWLFGWTFMVPFSFCFLLGSLQNKGYLFRHFCFIHFLLFLGTAYALGKQLVSHPFFRTTLYGMLGASLLCNFYYYLQSPTHFATTLAKLKADFSSEPVELQYRMHGLSYQTIRETLCAGRAVFSSNYIGAEALFYFCPEKWARLQTIDTQISFPNEEWRKTNLPPLLLMYFEDTPTRLLYHEHPEEFFSRYSLLPAREFYIDSEIRDELYVVWTHRSLPPPKPISVKGKLS